MKHGNEKTEVTIEFADGPQFERGRSAAKFAVDRYTTAKAGDPEGVTRFEAAAAARRAVRS